MFIRWIKMLLGIQDMPVNSWNIEKENEGLDVRDAMYVEVFGSKDFGSAPSKDWRPYYPKNEIQAHGDCVSFSRNNNAEIKAKFDKVLDEDGNEFNFSDLYLAVKSGTTVNGNSLKAVAEYARKYGVVLEKHAPYTRDWNKRNGIVNSVPSSVKTYKLGNWSWIGKNGYVSKQALKNALEYGPVQIGVGLGSTYNKGGIIRKPSNYTVYHALTLGYIDEKGNYYCYDHYARSQVVFDSEYPVLFAMSFRDLPKNWRGISVDGQKLHARLKGKYVMRAEDKGQLYHVLDDRLVKIDITTNYPELRDEVLRYLEIKEKFIGVSEKDFEKLRQVLTISKQ